jgi:hypothetical protein
MLKTTESSGNQLKNNRLNRYYNFITNKKGHPLAQTKYGGRDDKEVVSENYNIKEIIQCH